MPPIPRPRARLAGLTTGPPKTFSRGPRGPPVAAKQPAKPICPHCKGSDLFEENGELLCNNCMVQVAEANIVSDVTFEENAGGRSTVQGAFVTENSRHAKTFGSQALRRIGNNDRNYAADIEANGRRALDRLAPKLGIADNIRQQALSIWTLAANMHFSAGRKTDEVAAACLYAACRRQRDNNVLLMDLAEELRVNVFRLGEVYKDLCKELFLAKENVGYQHMVELEPLIHKYCQKLQFNEMTPVVANDALRIIRRMNRDWIVSGRHPAGLCGACIILAARMNNFNRSVREVVFVSKVADATIAKRVEEFRRTKSAALTVDQFRSYGNRMKFQHDPPSVYARDERDRILERRKRRRQEHLSRVSEQQDSQNRDTVDISDDEDEDEDDLSRLASLTPDPVVDDAGGERPSMPRNINGAGLSPPPSQPAASSYSTSSSTQTAATAIMSTTQLPTPAQTQSEGQPAARIDADGFAIPALPQQPDPPPSAPPSNTSRKRGRPRASDQPPAVVISEEELAEEDYLEAEIGRMLEDGQVMEARAETEKAKDEERAEQAHARAVALAQKQQKLEREKALIRRKGQAHPSDMQPDLDPTSSAPDPSIDQTDTFLQNDDDDNDLAREFADDPEVAACLLSPEESRIKAQIWVTHNEDWLRKQAEKDMLASVARASNPNYDPSDPSSAVRGGGGRRGRKAANGKERKKRGKMGDGSVLTNHSTPIESPADAARAMIEKRLPIKSQFVDFSALQRIYGRESTTPSRASTAEDDNDEDDPDGATNYDSRNTQRSSRPTHNSNPNNDADDSEPDADGADDVPSKPQPPRPAIQPATWDDVTQDLERDPDDDEAESHDFRKAMGIVRGLPDETNNDDDADYGVDDDEDDEFGGGDDGGGGGMGFGGGEEDEFGGEFE